MEILAYGILFFLLLRTLVAIVNALGSLYLHPISKHANKKLSVLIPARNEEKNLPLLLGSLLRSDYSHFEVWICDDQSSDSTNEILREWAERDYRINYFKGKDLPEGWVGKNFACHQLAEKAKGDYFMFLDADVTISKSTLSKAVSHAEKKELSLLSIFPKQIMLNISEHITVPFMNWALLNLLPLPLVFRSGSSAFSAANGQFMLFNAEEYLQNKWHKQVRQSNVEDILIARLMKKSNKKIAVLLGDDDVSCRMYSNYSDASNGFSRNVHEFFLGKRWLMVFFCLVLIFGPLCVFIYLGWQFLVIYLGLLLVNCIAVSLASRQNVFLNIILHPMQMLFFSQIVVNNLRLKIKKQSEWKGRILPV